MAKYSLTKNQVKVINFIFKKLPKNTKETINQKIKNVNINKQIQIGENKYKVNEYKIFLLKELMETYSIKKEINEVFNKETLKAKLKNIKPNPLLSKASFNSIPTPSKIKQIEETNIKEKVEKVKQNIIFNNKDIQTEIQKISNKIIEKFKKEYLIATSQSRNTVKKQNLEKIGKEIEKEKNKLLKNLNNVLIRNNREYFDDYEYITMEDWLEKDTPNLNIHLEENYMDDTYRKQPLNMENQEFRYLKHSLSTAHYISSNKERNIAIKEAKEKIQKYYDNRDLQIDSHHMKETKKGIIKINTEINKYSEKIEYLKEDINLNPLNIKNERAYIEPIDSYDSTVSEDDMSIINLRFKNGEIQWSWDSYEDWGTIPKGYEVNTNADINVNIVLLSKQLKRILITEIKKSKKIENIIKKTKEYKKEINKIKLGKSKSKIVSRKMK